MSGEGYRRLKTLRRCYIFFTIHVCGFGCPSGKHLLLGLEANRSLQVYCILRCLLRAFPEVSGFVLRLSRDGVHKEDWPQHQKQVWSLKSTTTGTAHKGNAQTRRGEGRKVGARRDPTTDRSDAHHVPPYSSPRVQLVYLRHKTLHSTQMFVYGGGGGL